MRLSRDVGKMPSWLGLAFAFGLFFSNSAVQAQNADCLRLKAALTAPVSVDAGAANAARKARGELDQLSAYAHSIGCDNQQFLFFGKAPPPQCGGVKAHMAALRAQADAAQARASGDNPQRRALVARYNAVCRENAAPPRERGLLETIFGGLGGEAPRDQEEAPSANVVEEGGPDDDRIRGGGSQAVCVRSCDGGFFPLTFSAHSASSDQLLELCRALCPNAEVQLFSRAPGRDISTAVSADGATAYSDLPNALKYTKTFDPNCGCKPPNQSWVEAYAHAEQLLNEMGGAKASDTVVTEQQAQAMSQPGAARPGKNADRRRTGTIAPTPDAVVVAPLEPVSPPKIETRTVDSPSSDGTPRPVRVVGPKL
jgi:hypothetical protein